MSQSIKLILLGILLSSTFHSESRAGVGTNQIEPSAQICRIIPGDSKTDPSVECTDSKLMADMVKNAYAAWPLLAESVPSPAQWYWAGLLNRLAAYGIGHKTSFGKGKENTNSTFVYGTQDEIHLTQYLLNHGYRKNTDGSFYNVNPDIVAPQAAVVVSRAVNKQVLGNGAGLGHSDRSPAAAVRDAK